MKMSQRGQMNTGIVWGVIIMLVSICIGGLVFGAIQKATETQAAGTGTTFTNQLLNTSFTDNTVGKINSWDNYKENGAVNSWDSNGYAVVTSTENESTKIDNGVFYQSVTVSTIYNKIVGATTTFTYRVYDNDNAVSIRVRAYLYNGTDNTLLYSENDTLGKSTSWTTVENDVSAYVTTTGTYTLYLRAELLGYGPGDSGKGTNCVVQFGEANLAIDTYSNGIAENIVGETGAAGGSIFPLIILMVTVGVFVAIISVLKYLG